MTMLMPGSLGMLSWARQGLAGDALVNKTAVTQKGRLELPVQLRVNSNVNINMPVRFFGPADVTGIDVQQVIRTEPVALSANFEPNLFPHVEFDRPDLPWMFSPTAPDAQHRWQPWITLIVLPKAAAQIQMPEDATHPLPRVDCPVAELPSLAEAWAWAHAQVAQGAGKLETKDLLRSGPRSLSRLIAARRLDPLTSYVACVVPTYEVGRKAGLGETPTDEELQALAPAWPEPSGAGQNAHVVLPAYYHWEFVTGEQGDFESLARKMTPQPVPDDVGEMTIDTSRPGWGMLPAHMSGDPTATLHIEGALLPVGNAVAVWPVNAQNDFRNRLRDVLNKPQALTDQGEIVPLIGPPVYGQWYPRVSTVPAEGQKPVWLRELNVQVKHRIAAGLGALVVRFEQEALMAAAWEQLAEWKRENQKRQRQQLAEEVQGAMRARLEVSTGAGLALRRSLFATERNATLLRIARPGTAAAKMFALRTRDSG